MKKLLTILLPLALVILGGVFFARHLGDSASFGEVEKSLMELPAHVSGVGSAMKAGGSVQKESSWGWLNPFHQSQSERGCTFAYGNRRTGSTVTVSMHERAERINRIVITPNGDAKFAGEIKQYLLNRHPNIGTKISFGPVP